MSTRVLIDFRSTTPHWRLDPFEFGAESLHADPVLAHQRQFVVDNIPFFTHEVACGDVVATGEHAGGDSHWDGRVVHDVVSGEDCARFTIMPDTADEEEAARLLRLAFDMVKSGWPECKREGGMGLLAVQSSIEDGEAIEAWLEDDGRYAFVMSTRTFTTEENTA